MLDPVLKKIQDAYKSKVVNEAKDEFLTQAEKLIGGKAVIISDSAAKKVADIIYKGKEPKPGFKKESLRGRPVAIFIDKEEKDWPVAYVLAKDKKFFDAIGAIKEDVEEDDLSPKTFGLTDDGWDKDDLSDLIDALEDAEKMKYELDGARRGSYGISGDTLQDLVKDIKDLAERLEAVANEIEEQIED